MNCGLDLIYDLLGIKQRAFYYTPWISSSHILATPIEYPAIDENYFEYIDVLEACFCNVQSKRESFTMFELGAGWGRWIIVANTALKKLGYEGDERFVGIEADKAHYEFMKLHFHDNGVQPSNHLLLNKAIWKYDGDVLFFRQDPFDNYGQCVAGELNSQVEDGNTFTVKAVSLSNLLNRYDIVDLIHMDIQGAELEVISSSLELINKKVRCIHIGTHSKEIEDDLCKLFLSIGWKCTTLYRCASNNTTPFGEVHFVDGIQTWHNMAV